MKNYICAIVVIYHPDIERLNALLVATIAMVDRLVIVDNGSDLDIREELLIELQETGLLTYLLMDNNIGLAAGLNQGITWAMENNFTHVLLLDQDSIPQENMVKNLLLAADKIESDGINLAAVGSKHFDPRTGYISSFDQPKIKSFGLENDKESSYYEVGYLQSSGALISIKTLNILGLMDTGLFIHHIDQEWCLRASDRGFKSFGVSNALMEHIVGDKVVRIWLGYWRDIHLHSPARHYFAFRNSILLYKRKYIPFTWKIADIARLLFMFVFYSLFIPPRLNHASMMFRGLWDGILGKTGGL